MPLCQRPLALTTAHVHQESLGDCVCTIWNPLALMHWDFILGRRARACYFSWMSFLLDEVPALLRMEFLAPWHSLLVQCLCNACVCTFGIPSAPAVFLRAAFAYHNPQFRALLPFRPEFLTLAH